MTEQQACTLCGADGHRAYACPMRVEEHPPILVPWSVLDRAVMWVEDRRRYGDDGTIADDWLALKAIQRAALAQPSPAPEVERPAVVAKVGSDGSGGKVVSPRMALEDAEIGEELMTVAQCERIVSVWRERVRSTYVDLTRRNNELIVELNAAQARAAELEKQQPVAWAVFSENGNVICWSQRRDHVSLTACEDAGHKVTPVYTAPVAQAGQAPDIAAPLSECMALAQTVFARLEGMMPQGKKLPENHVARRLLAELEKLQQLAAAPAQGGE